jgi:hypothetical protein
LAAPLFIGFCHWYDHHVPSPAILTPWLASIASEAFPRFTISSVPDISFKLGHFAPDGIARPSRQCIPGAKIGA